MTVYQYPDSPVIDEVDFRKTENGAVRAYLHAKDGLPLEKIQAVMAGVRAAGHECIPSVVGGKPTLEVRGFGKEAKLLGTLKPWIEGKPEIIRDKEGKIGWIDWIKKRSLQASGFLYAVGDINFIRYGVKGKSPLDAAAGVLYFAPTPALITYGRNDQSEYQIKDMAKQLSSHLRKAVKDLPEDCALQSMAEDHKKGLLGNVDALLKRYPSEFMNLCYASAGACILNAALKHIGHINPSAKNVEATLAFLKKNNPAATFEDATKKAIKSIKIEEWFNIGVGVSTVSSGLFGALVKEKAHDPDDKPKSGLAGLWDFVQRKPLAVAGGGLMVSTLLHAISTAVAIKGHDAERKSAVWSRAIFVGTNILAEIMVMISSKGHGEGVVNDHSVGDSVIALAADLIVKQPKAMQAGLVDYVSKFLGQADMLALKDTQVAEKLRGQIEAMRSNPWAQVNCEAPHCAPQPLAAAMPTPAAPESSPAKPWSEKISPAALLQSLPAQHASL